MEDPSPGGFALSESGSPSRGDEDDPNQQLRKMQIAGFHNASGNMTTNMPAVHAVDGT
jgi:hypothetical protein